VLATLVAIFLCSNVAGAQSRPSIAGADGVIAETVVSAQPNSLTVRTEDGRCIVFAMHRGTVRPRTAALGARVSVQSTADDDADEDTRTATRITLSGTQPTADTSTTGDDAIPASVHQLERQIATSARRYRVGAGGGPTLGLSHRGVSTQTGGRVTTGFAACWPVEKPGGVFIELKATIYADPHVRMIFGVTF
jgi:hypothetical protein